MIVSINEEEFWSNVYSGDPEDCWEWTGQKLSSGYGRFRVQSGDSGRLRANRISLCLATGEDYENPLEALHRCDNPPCCNPDHLYWGTQADNVQDRVEAGRSKGGGWFRNVEAAAKAMELLTAGVHPKIAAAETGISYSYARALKKKVVLS